MDIIPNFPSASKLTIAWFLLLLTTVDRSLSVRTLNNPPPRRHQQHHHNHRPITFYMPQKLTNTYPAPTSPSTTNENTNQQLPFSKPLGFFPPSGGILIPMPNSNPTVSAQTINFPGIGISFPARATLEELELGTVTVIDEDLFGDSYFGIALLGKAKGMYVVSREDGISSHMMALTASFANGEYKDGLKFFGVYRKDVSESHIAVIGGTGKYHGANGYATFKAVNVSSSHAMWRESAAGNKFHLFNVYLG